jgi:hypothetical protein
MSGPAGARSNAPRLEGTLQFAHAFLDIAPYGNVAPYGFGSGETTMIYILAALVPPLGLLLNGQPFSAVFNVLLIMFGLLFGWFFPVLFLLPSIHAVVAVHMRREDRRHRELVDAIERHGPPPWWIR